MGRIAKQALSNSVLISIGTVIGYLNIILLFPKIFEENEFGLTRVLLSFSGIIAIFSQFGFTNVIIKFFPYYKENEKKRQTFLFLVFSFPFIVITIISLFLLLLKPFIATLFSERSSLFLDYYYLIIPLSYCQLYFHILSSYLRAIFKSVQPLALQEIGVRSTVTGLILAYHFDYLDFYHFIIFFVAFHAVPSVVMMINNFSFRPQLFRLGSLNMLDLRSIFSFASFNFLNRASGNLTKRIDILMLSSLAGLKEVGIYTIAFLIGSFIEFASQGLRQISTPFVATAFAEKDFNKVSEVNKKASVNQLILGGLLVALIFPNAQQILTIINENYKVAHNVIIFIGLSRLMMVGAGVTPQIIDHSVYYKFNLLFKIIQLIILVVLNYLLIKMIGIDGAALATMIAVMTESSLKLIFTWGKMGFNPFSLDTLKTLFSIGLALMVGYFLKDFKFSFLPGWMDIYLNLIYQSSIIGIIFLASVIYLKPSDDLDNLIKKYAPF